MRQATIARVLCAVSLPAAVLVLGGGAGFAQEAGSRGNDPRPDGEAEFAYLGDDGGVGAVVRAARRVQRRHLSEGGRIGRLTRGLEIIRAGQGRSLSICRVDVSGEKALFVENRRAVIGWVVSAHRTAKELNDGDPSAAAHDEVNLAAVFIATNSYDEAWEAAGDGRSRRRAAIADRDRERLKWAGKRALPLGAVSAHKRHSARRCRLDPIGATRAYRGCLGKDRSRPHSHRFCRERGVLAAQ